MTDSAHIQSTPDSSNLIGKSKKVRVIGSLKQIAGNKKISLWIGRECKYNAHFTARAARDTDRCFE